MAVSREQLVSWGFSEAEADATMADLANCDLEAEARAEADFERRVS